MLKKSLLFLLVGLMTLSVIATGCTPSGGVTSEEYFTVYSGEVSTMNYLVTATEIEMLPAANIVSGLMEHDNFGVLKPSAAESVQISDDGTVYTFTLREGQMWYRHDGTEWGEHVAQDYVDAIKYTLDPANSSNNAHIRDYLANAQDYYMSLVDEDVAPIDFAQVGIKALDKYTVEYTLVAPTPWFLSLMTHTIYRPAPGAFLEETGTMFGTGHTTLLSNGPYILENFQPQNIREYVRNENYWDVENVHIPRLTYQFNREAGTLAPDLFWRGEITGTSLPSAVLQGWLDNPERADYVTPADVNWMWNFWWAFNFDPQFGDEWEPENWRAAVMNVNFRKAIWHGLDRVAAQMTVDAINPERQMKNTITPPNYVSVQGVDYTMLPPLEKFTTTDPFQADLAKEYRDKAMEELEGIVTFPVKIKWTFNEGGAANGERAQVIEQQLENLLGADFIDIMPEGYAATGYLDNTRRNGNYAMQDLNQGSTYLDPYSYTSPFHYGNSSWTDSGLAIGTAYQELLDRAHAERIDLDRRYELFAEAEAYLLENAIALPWRGGGGGYQATRMQPFTAPYSAVGLSYLGYKYRVIRDDIITAEEYEELRAQWQADREEALRAAGQ